jgi:hypothetical protein
VIGFGANLSTTCSNALVGLETRICAALTFSQNPAGTKIADARVLRSRPMYFRFVKKLISPCVRFAERCCACDASASNRRLVRRRTALPVLGE